MVEPQALSKVLKHATGLWNILLQIRSITILNQHLQLNVCEKHINLNLFIWIQD